MPLPADPTPTEPWLAAEVGRTAQGVRTVIVLPPDLLAAWASPTPPKESE